MSTGEKDIDIWQNRVEDYLDDTRRLTEAETISYEVRVAHDLFDIQDYEELATKAKEDFYEQERT